jgi:Uma2 family endonuclease
MAVQLLRRLFTVDEYSRMAKAGIFSVDERVELIEGEIVAMASIGSRHAACVRRLSHLFSQRIGGQALLSAQNPVRLSRYSEPQPDMALLRPRPDFYAQAHPGPGDVFLVIEVADTSVGFDREVKMPLYARAGIPEAWLVDLDGAYIAVYRQPAAEGYHEVIHLQRGHSLTPEAFPDLVLPVDDILR